MAFAGELLTYLFKFIILGAVTIVAVICGAKYKKSKLAKATAASEGAEIKTKENKEL